MLKYRFQNKEGGTTVVLGITIGNLKRLAEEANPVIFDLNHIGMGDGVFAIGTRGVAAAIRDLYAPQRTCCIELNQEQSDLLTSRAPVFRTFQMLGLPGDGWVMVLCGESEDELFETFQTLGFIPADAKPEVSDFSAPEPSSENIAAVLAKARAARGPGPIHLSREELVPPGGSPDMRIDLRKIDEAIASVGGGPRVVAIDLRSPEASSAKPPPPAPPPSKAAAPEPAPTASPGRPVVVVESRSQGLPGITFEAPTSPGQPRVIRVHTSQPEPASSEADHSFGPHPKAILGALAASLLAIAVFAANKGDNIPAVIFAVLGAIPGLRLLTLGESALKRRASWRPRQPKWLLVGTGLFLLTAVQVGLEKRNYLGTGFFLLMGLVIGYAGIYYEEIKR